MGALLILICTVIWGTAFLAQKTGAEYFGPFTLTCYRNALAGVFLAVVILLRNAVRERRFAIRLGRTETLGGAASGAVLFAAMVTQQLGIEWTTPGISAFLTANYILFVPFLAWAIGGGRPPRVVWLAVAMALAGTYLICDIRGLSPGRGESWTLLCAALFAVQIMVVDRCASKADVPVFSMVQLFTAAVCAAPFLFCASETARLTAANLRAGWFQLFYVGVVSSGIAYTLQNLGQARTPATVASVVMSFESVVGAIAGYFVLGDRLSTAQIAGCLLVFSGIIVSQMKRKNFSELAPCA